MGRKWGRKKWFEYHQKKAAEAAIDKYASAEKAALDGIDLKIAQLERELKQLTASQSSISSLVSIFFPNQIARDLQAIRINIQELRQQRATLYHATRDVIDRAAARGVSEYHTRREFRAEEMERAAKERRIRYLERSPAIRSAQSTIKQHILAEYSETEEIICYYCKESLQPEEVHIEHKTPISRGGTNSRKNLALACAKCNLSKGRKTEAEFLRYRDGKG